VEINKSITLTATGVSKTPMQFDHVQHEDGSYFVRYQQGYQFVDAKGEGVHGIQKEYFVQGEISDADLQAQLPDVWNALVFLWGFFEGEIRKQEGIA